MNLQMEGRTNDKKRNTMVEVVWVYARWFYG